MSRPDVNNPVVYINGSPAQIVWEYECLVMNSKNPDIQKRMNELGEHGYECFNCINDGLYMTMLFKRSRIIWKGDATFNYLPDNH